MGSSKTGSIAYIEPEATLQYSRELSNLEYEEKGNQSDKIIIQSNSALFKFTNSISGFLE
jgi:DNA mismatch repair protein MutS2